MKKVLSLLLLLTALVPFAIGQTYNQMDANGNITQGNDRANFNPNKRDTLGNSSNKEVPYGLRVWTVNAFGDVANAQPDTLPHLFQNTIHNTGLYGEYNTLGNNYTARESRIFIDRPEPVEFYFTQPYSFTTVEPTSFHFMNTLSPFTNISYDECGDKQNGEDHIQAKFAVNANQRMGAGFDLDYYYATGYYANQNNAHFRASLFASYLGDKYQMHFLGSLYHRKTNENGGITQDTYVTHPESIEETFSENEIPTTLEKNWNRNNSQHFFLTHRYNIGFYRTVQLTEEEAKARKFAEKSAAKKKEKEGKDAHNAKGRMGGTIAGDEPKGRPDDAPVMGDEPDKQQASAADDSTRVQVESQAMMDSLRLAKAEEDSLEQNTKKIYVPVTSFIHTIDISNHDRTYLAYVSPDSYYANTYYDLNDEGAYSGDSIYDKTRMLSMRNTLALSLAEGFNKYMKAGIKAYIAHDFFRFQMPDLMDDDPTAYYMNKWTESGFSLGGQISKTQGQTLHFNLTGELGVAGRAAGNVRIDFNTDLNFPLFGDTVQLAAKAYYHSFETMVMQRSFHSKHFWWDKSLDNEKRTRIEGLFSYTKTDTRLRVAVDQIHNYTYFGMSYDTSDKGPQNMTVDIFQHDGPINIVTAQLQQNVRLGIFNWENVITYQLSDNDDVLPLPKLNLFSNMYLKFRIARVLGVELGASAIFFTKYKAPDFVPMLNQFAIQQNEDSRVELGGYPFVDVYANFHLKRTRFFLAMTHVNAGSGNRMQFLTPHYPTDNRILRFGVSWTFIN